MPHRIEKGVLMARKKEKEFTCTVEVTEGFSDRLTRGLVDIYYRRKMMAALEGKAPGTDEDK